MNKPAPVRLILNSIANHQLQCQVLSGSAKPGLVLVDPGRGVTLTIDPGEFVAMAGPPGHPRLHNPAQTWMPGRKAGHGDSGDLLVKPALALDESGDLVEPAPDAQIAEDKRSCAAHALGVALHHLERRPDIRRKVDLVNDQEIGARDARAAL